MGLRLRLALFGWLEPELFDQAFANALYRKELFIGRFFYFFNGAISRSINSFCFCSSYAVWQ